MHLTEQERTALGTLVAEAEARTGAQVVTAVVGKADSYAEAPWKAFALGAAAAALAVVAFMPRDWDPGASAIRDAAIILGCGATLALLTVFLPPFARSFIDAARREVEVTQFAQSLFFTRGLGRTRGRLGVLILVSLFERKVVILADDGFDGRIGPRDWQALAARMTLQLHHRNAASALRSGVQGLEALLLEHGFVGHGAAAEDMSNAPLQLKGER